MNEQLGNGGGRLQAGPGGKGAERVIPFGKYLLVDRIAVGGMAEVYTAKSFGVEGFEKILAIKRILPTMAEDEDFIQMFIDEAKIAGQLTHANIVPIYELGKIGDSHYIAMEYVWGKDLLQIMNRFRKMRKQMPASMGAWIGAKMCEGLDYAHRKKDRSGRPLGIIHRDVSPQNCLVSYEGQVKMIDFGIAKAASRNTKTQAGVLKGKFGYMSPEQVRGLTVDHRSDIFAVGTCLYEMLTTERLFVGESDFSTLEKVRNAQVPALSLQVPDIPKELEDIVMKALTRDAEHRWQSASEMQEALQRFIARERPPFGTSKLAAWMRTAFAPEMAKEKQRLDSFAKIGPPAAAPAAPPRPPPPPKPAANDDDDPGELIGEATMMTASPFEEGAPSESGGGDIQEQATQIFFSADEMDVIDASRPTMGHAPAGPAPMPRVGAVGVQQPPRPVGLPPPGAPMRPQPMVAVGGPPATAPMPMQGPSVQVQGGFQQPAPAPPPPGYGQPQPMMQAGPPPGMAPPPPQAQFGAPPPSPQRTDTMQLQSPPQVAFAVPTAQAAPEQKKSRRGVVGFLLVATLGVLGVGMFAGYYFVLRGPALGTIEVRAVPAEAANARVSLDGQPRGPAPIRIEGVLAGEHVLVLSQPGFQDVTRPVVVTENGTVALDIALTPALAVAAAPPPVAVPAPVPAPIGAAGAIAPAVEPVAAPAPAAPPPVAPPPIAAPAPVAPAPAPPPPVAAAPPPPAPAPAAAPPSPPPTSRPSASAPAPSPRPAAAPSPAPRPSPAPAAPPPTSTRRPVAAAPEAAPTARPGRPTRGDPPASTTTPPPPSGGRGAAAGQGTLQIQTLPWARVFIDGRDTGRNTPVRELRVSAGSHRIGLRTADGRMTELTIQVPANETVRIVRQL